MNAPTTDITLSAADRNRLRSTITSHPGWKNWSQVAGVTADVMDKGKLLLAATTLGVDIKGVLAAEEQPRPNGATLNGRTLTLHPPAQAELPLSEAASQLATLIGRLATPHTTPVDLAVVDARIAGLRAELIEACATLVAEAGLVRIELTRADTAPRRIEGASHPKLATLLRAAASRMANGVQPNIWLAGPAGSGKTHAASQVADALEVAFHYNGAISMPHELLGFIDAAGKYHRTPFREAYEHGGVYLFDEVDGSDNAALLALNAALANARATFPDGQIARHASTVIIATANTWGLGGTADYVGRAKIDAAFLSRFPVRIGWEYDDKLEIQLSGNEKWARRVITAREKARAAGVKVIIDPRASQAGAALIAAGMSMDEAAEMTYLANLTPEQRKMIG